MTILMLSIIGWSAIAIAALVPAGIFMVLIHFRKSIQAGRERLPTLRMRTTG